MQHLRADILEVVHALAADLGTTKDSLETTRAEKARERGAFTDRTVWTGITGPENAKR